MNLDEIDKQILNELFEDGRTNLSKFKVQLNQKMMSHTGIKKRITKLEQLGILKVQGNIGINTLNYNVMFILLEMKNYEEIKKVTSAYSECPRVFLLAHISGQYNLIMGVIGQNVDVLHRYLNCCGPTNKEGILHSQILFASNIIAPQFFPINLFSNISKESKCGNICKKCEAFLDGKCDGCGEF
ncbi:MAG TPA: hypothetical protein VGB37_13640 [Candidatus Lokiarchaeia archaeon]